MDSMEFNTRAHGFHGFHGFHGIHGADVRSMVVISSKHLTRERTGVMAYRAGSARVSIDRSHITAGVRFCGSHRLAHLAPTRAHSSSWRSQKSFLGLEIGDGDPLKTRNKAPKSAALNFALAHVGPCPTRHCRCIRTDAHGPIWRFFREMAPWRERRLLRKSLPRVALHRISES
jgi:hypothetical protein